VVTMHMPFTHILTGDIVSILEWRRFGEHSSLYHKALLRFEIRHNVIKPAHYSTVLLRIKENKIRYKPTWKPRNVYIQISILRTAGTVCEAGLKPTASRF
jgi:hypothetical protein